MKIICCIKQKRGSYSIYIRTEKGTLTRKGQGAKLPVLVQSWDSGAAGWKSCWLKAGLPVPQGQAFYFFAQQHGLFALKQSSVHTIDDGFLCSPENRFLSINTHKKNEYLYSYLFYQQHVNINLRTQAWYSRKKSPRLSLRGAERRGNLGFSSTYTRRDCFTSFAMTTFLTFYGTINFEFWIK